VKVKNVGKEEGIFRVIIGVILIILAFFIEGILRWVVGLIGVIFILTAIFGY
jgi:predicted phage tail protein